MTSVVTFGEAMGLFLAADGRPLRQARAFDREVAGAELNVAVALARLGHEVGWFGRLGRDAAGDEVVATLRATDVDTSRVIRDETRPTGLLVRDRHPERRVSVDYHRRCSAASALEPADVDVAYVRSARLLHATGITPALSASARAATLTAMRAARDAGVTTSFDPNLRLKLWSAGEARPVLAELAALADLVLAGDDEATLVAGTPTPEDAAAWFLAHGSRIVVVKQGAAGAWATDGDITARVSAPPVTVTDPVGAGDAFDAGFLGAWLAGDPLERCLAVGAAIGAACVQAPGDLAGLPTRAELAGVLEHVTEADR